MRTVNEVILIGWVANDPVMKEIKNGQHLTIFSLATKRVWTTKSGERKEESQFHRMVCWGKLGDRVAKIVKRGEMVYTRGYLHNRRIEIENEEKPRVVTEIVVNDLLVLKRKDNRKQDSQESENKEE